jgi:hypothetical protein
MILNEEILKLAKTCGFEEFIGERDDETDGVYYQFWEEQLIAFAQKIYQMGYDDGCYETSYSTGYTGLVGDPQ